MSTPERSAALARVLASGAGGLPKDFATQVAALAEADRTRLWNWDDLAMSGAFVAVIGVYVAGWFTFAPREPGGVEWLGPLIHAVASEPWMVTGLAGLGLVQMLAFRRRAAI
jgi:hypothetical protein